MMEVLLCLCLIIALVCFVLAAMLVASPRVNLVALGWVFFTLYFLIPLLVNFPVHRSHFLR